MQMELLPRVPIITQTSLLKSKVRDLTAERDKLLALAMRQLEGLKQMRSERDLALRRVDDLEGQVADLRKSLAEKSSE